MAAPKYANLYVKNKDKKSPSKPAPKKEKSNKEDKLIIEQLKENLSKKLRDPEMAKKAAQIISELLYKK